MTCPVCGTVAVPGARFCHNCGAALPAAATLPAAERRIVTVLFGDLSDFTSWSEDLDPERVGAVTDRVLAALAGAVKTFGGHVDKLTGDTVLGRGTTVVAWPDGDLGDYLESLRHIAELGPGVPALPGHGPPLSDSSIAATFYLQHRLARLDQVRGALKAGDTSAEEVVARVYADVDKSLWPAAESSVRAQLAYLRRESHPPSPELDSP